MELEPIHLLIGLFSVYFLWIGKIFEFLFILLLWLFLLFISRL